MNNIDKKYKTIATKKEKTTILASYHLFKKILDLILIEKNKDKEDSDLENSFQF